MRIPSKDSLDILHDHYKETFALIREREKERDQSFLYMTGVIGALFVSSYYAGFIPQTIKFTPYPGVADFSLPAAVAVSVLWFIFLILSLRYCSRTVLVDRQYEYLHMLEDKVSAILGDNEIYQREGKIYNENYPIVSWWIWFAYAVLFPAIVIVSAIILLDNQWTSYFPSYSRLYNTIFGFGVIMTFVLYKGAPLFRKLYRVALDKLRNGKISA